MKYLNPVHGQMFTQSGVCLGGHYDSLQLQSASELTIQARKQGLKGALIVKSSYGGKDAFLVDEEGERWIPQQDGDLASLSEIESWEDYSSEGWDAEGYEVD